MITTFGYATEKLSYRVLTLLMAACYGIVLANLPIDAFVDRDNYLVYASSSFEIITRYTHQGIWSTLFNEPIWLLVNILLGSFFSSENVLRLIIFFSSFTTAYLLLRYSSKNLVLLLLFLLLPQVLKNNIIHLRQGLAIALFVTGWFSCRSVFRYIFYALACFVHSSFFIIIFLVVLNDLLLRFRFASDIRSTVVFAAGLLVGLLGLWVADLLGARQASQYSGDLVAVSGLGFVFWATIAAIFALEGKVFLRNNSLQYSIIIFYLSTYFFLPVTARVFESGLLLVLLSSLNLTSYRKYMFFLAISLYFLIQWSTRIFLPGFGWGVENYI